MMLGRCLSRHSLGPIPRHTPSITNAIRSKSSSTKPPPSRKSTETPPRSRRYPGVLFRWLTVGGAIFFGGHIFNGYFFEYGPCDGISMTPTWNSFGDGALISKWYRRGRGVQVGDTILFAHPVMPGGRSLKRVLGLEGDFVLRDTPNVGEEGEEKMIQVPKGHCWVVGDNLDYSRDSRMFGPLPMALIKGKVIGRTTGLTPVKVQGGLLEPEYDSDSD